MGRETPLGQTKSSILNIIYKYYKDTVRILAGYCGGIEYGEDKTKPETVNVGNPYMISALVKAIQTLEARIAVLERS